MTNRCLELDFLCVTGGEITVCSLKLTDCQAKIHYSSSCLN